MHDPYGDPTDISGVRDDAPMETKSTMGPRVEFIMPIADAEPRSSGTRRVAHEAMQIRLLVRMFAKLRHNRRSQGRVSAPWPPMQGVLALQTLRSKSHRLELQQRPGPSPTSDDMCARYQDAKAAGDDVDDPKIYKVKPERSPNG